MKDDKEQNVVVLGVLKHLLRNIAAI